MYKQQRTIDDNGYGVPAIEKVHNHFDIEIKNIETGKTEMLRAENTVLDVAWRDYIFKKEALILRLGSSTEPESPDQTNVLKQIHSGKTSSETTYSRHEANGNARRSKYFYGTTEVNGQTIAELALVNATNSTTAFNRAILKDLNGNPIKIDKTELMEITIYVTVYVTITLQPNQGVISSSSLFSLINNGNQDVRLRTYNEKSNSLPHTYNITENKLEQVCTRVTPGELNTCIVALDSYGIRTDLMNSPKKYRIENYSLGVGDGSKTTFWTGYFIDSIEIYRNGVLIPESEYVFNKISAGSVADVDRPSMGRRCRNHMTDQYGTLMNVNPTSGSSSVLFKSWPDTKMGLNIDGMLFKGFSCNVGAVSVTYYLSDDGINWTKYNIPPYTGQHIFPKPCKYVKLDASKAPSNGFIEFGSTADEQIIFNTPPASGDVLTFNATTGCIPKNSDHVLDITTSLEFSKASV